LGNDEKRQQYDQFGATFDQQGGFGGGMNWEDFMRAARQGGSGDFSAGGGSAFGGDMGDMGDIFSDLFENLGFGFGSRGRSRTKTRNRGRDIEIDLTLEFKEAIFGAEQTIELMKLNTCSKCQGNGAEPGSKIINCKTCNGQGSVRTVKRTILGNIQTVSACPDCHGDGKSFEKACINCHGQGRIKEKVKIDLKVPAGINEGMTLKMAAAGESGIKGGKAGDLFIHIHIKEDPYFKRQDDNIMTKNEISFSIAALGGQVAIKTIDGEVNMKIPPGTQTGKIFILRGKGAPHFQHYGRGDQLIEVIIKTPGNLTRRQQELLEELGEEGI